MSFIKSLIITFILVIVLVVGGGYYYHSTTIEDENSCDDRKEYLEYQVVFLSCYIDSIEKVAPYLTIERFNYERRCIFERLTGEELTTSTVPTN